MFRRAVQIGPGLGAPGEVGGDAPDLATSRTGAIANERVTERLAGALELTRRPRLVARTEFRWSEHLLYEFEEGSSQNRRVLVKRMKAHDRLGRVQDLGIRPEARAGAEYEALARIHRIISSGSHPGLTSVRPYACFPDLAAVAMEFRAGCSILTDIRHATLFPYVASPGKLIEGATSGGRWLGILHQAMFDAGDAIPVRGTAYFQELSGDLARLAQRLFPHRAQLRRSLQRFMEHRVETAPVRTIPIHGDLYPDNLVVAQDGPVYGVDTTLLKRGAAEEDVARFHVGVETLRARILWGDALVRTEPMRQVQQAMIEGYRQARPLSAALLQSAIARAYLLRWVELRVALEKRPSVIARAMRRRIDTFMEARLGRFLARPATP